MTSTSRYGEQHISEALARVMTKLNKRNRAFSTSKKGGFNFCYKCDKSRVGDGDRCDYCGHQHKPNKKLSAKSAQVLREQIKESEAVGE